MVIYIIFLTPLRINKNAGNIFRNITDQVSQNSIKSSIQQSNKQVQKYRQFRRRLIKIKQ